MQIENKLLIDELLQFTDHSIKSVVEFKNLRPEQLNYKNSSMEWSALQCIEHLNLYGDFYLPEIEKQILHTRNLSGKLIFKSGFIGNYFAELMLANKGKLKKMKSPKDKIPSASELSITTLDRFLKQQERLKTLLEQAKTIDLTRAKSAISLSKLIKLRLGDTFRFYVYHVDRHIQQAHRALNHEHRPNERKHTNMGR
jgi:hypothetical protein